jgi:hypothetical protein
VFQISVSSTYGVTEFKENLLSLYRRAGTKGTPITFLMTDNQVGTRWVGWVRKRPSMASTSPAATAAATLWWWLSARGSL